MNVLKDKKVKKYCHPRRRSAPIATQSYIVHGKREHIKVELHECWKRWMMIVGMTAETL